MNYLSTTNELLYNNTRMVPRGAIGHAYPLVSLHKEPKSQTGQSGGEVSNPGRAPPLERHDKGSPTRLGLLYFCDPGAWR